MRQSCKHLLALGLLAAASAFASASSGPAGAAAELERAAQLAAGKPEADESYQRVYEAFSKLVDNVSTSSLANVRRLVQRLDRLVGGPKEADQLASPQLDRRTEQILERLDKVDGQTDGHTINKLSEDISKLIGTLNDAYLRNVRRLIERVNKVVGPPPKELAAHQASNQLEDPGNRQPGFPGWDEVIVAVDRIQKSLAHFVRSTTRLVTSG